MLDISCSIVLYNNPVAEIRRAIESVLNSSLKTKIILVDNSEDDSRRFEFISPQVEYIYTGKNLGYGRAHNLALEKIKEKTKYHLILNPDVEFDPMVLNRLFRFMEKRKDVGLVMPKVLYKNGETQYLCKMLPSPADLILRRFIPASIKRFFRKTMAKYELKHKDYNSIMDIPNLSGCFMFIREEVFHYIGMFDERYFLYLEDTDLCRRINEYYRTIYFPGVSILHGYSKASYKSFRLMRHHLSSSIKYFNKWGWLLDKKRKEINFAVLHNEYMPALEIKRELRRIEHLDSFFMKKEKKECLPKTPADRLTEFEAVKTILDNETIAV